MHIELIGQLTTVDCLYTENKKEEEKEKEKGEGEEEEKKQRRC